MSEWIHSQLGVDAGNLYPSVRSGLEGAVLMAIASAQGRPLSDLLAAAISEYVNHHHFANMATNTGMQCLCMAKVVVRHGGTVGSGQHKLLLEGNTAAGTWQLPSCLDRRGFHTAPSSAGLMAAGFKLAWQGLQQCFVKCRFAAASRIIRHPSVTAAAAACPGASQCPAQLHRQPPGVCAGG